MWLLEQCSIYDPFCLMLWGRVVRRCEEVWVKCTTRGMGIGRTFEVVWL